MLIISVSIFAYLQQTIFSKFKFYESDRDVKKYLTFNKK
jgi:hypothetical protein